MHCGYYTTNSDPTFYYQDLYYVTVEVHTLPVKTRNR
jgi:hypothetical protein